MERNVLRVWDFIEGNIANTRKELKAHDRWRSHSTASTISVLCVHPEAQLSWTATCRADRFKEYQ